MKRRFLPVLLLISLLLLGGCSWIHEFVLVNKSGKDLSVTYQLNPASDGLFDSVPRLVNGNLRDTLNYTYNPINRTVQFQLTKGSKVVIGHDLNASFDDYKNDPKRFNLAGIQTDGLNKQFTASEIIQQTTAKKIGEAVLELR